MLEAPTKATATSTATTTTITVTVTTSIVGTACACDLNSEAIAILQQSHQTHQTARNTHKFVAVASADRIVCIAAIIELCNAKSCQKWTVCKKGQQGTNECESRSSGTALDADVADASILQATAGPHHK